MPQVETGDLVIAYEDHGEGGAPVALLLHGWPDDASTWDGVVPALGGEGRRVVVPTLRGFGATRFRSPEAPRTADSSILAMDALALMDALGVERFAVVGHDWGSNIAEALAVGWPDRVERIALMCSPPRLGGVPTPPFRQTQRQWYHWYMATRRGAQAVRADPHGFARLMWENWSPPGWFDGATFESVAQSWDNPAWVDVTLHSYQARWQEAEPDPRSAWLEEKVRGTRTLSLPAIYVQGEVDGVNPPEASKDVPSKFTGPFELIQMAGVGHFPQREAPAETARHLSRFLVERGS